ncbi:hypothetical protein ELQ35_22165 [Peribacillus cavernae]|uniref:Uncharacterized protein n=1 Tax=Peribacillus cavernae TaxID=1674310 RepID=A0A3S0TWI4_9BACI|nr:hypothetical protein [Peribacillus cavernae]MDQ0220149.1 hypothetical protein [Peribacillus cavernae]RUQ24206.1 hypothetical protein ELQ35_22165 [Peribacillus cavernae]
MFVWLPNIIARNSKVFSFLDALNTIAFELKRSNDITEGKHLKRIADEIAEYEPKLAMILDVLVK